MRFFSAVFNKSEMWDLFLSTVSWSSKSRKLVSAFVNSLPSSSSGGSSSGFSSGGSCGGSISSPASAI